MLKIGQLLMIWLCVLVMVCVYSCCIFLLVKEYSAIFWVSYVSTVVAFLLYSAAIFIIGKKGGRAMKMEVSAPILSYLNISMGVQIFVGAIFMLLSFSIGVAIVLEAILQIFLVIEGVYILRYYLK